MSTVYKIKDGVTKEDFYNAGYLDITPEMLGTPTVEEEIIYKLVPQKKNSEPVKYAIAMFDHPDWQNYHLPNGGDDYFKLIMGIDFEDVWSEKDGVVKRVVRNKALYNLLKNWRIEINFTEKEELWLGFTILDASFPKTFYAKECLDKYCKKEIENLLELGLIEPAVIEQ